MTERNTSREETVDWAERLKASMDARPSDAPPPVTEEDDLAALLRAQLAHREEPVAPSPCSLSTEEFEEETDEELPWEDTDTPKEGEDIDTPEEETDEELPWEDTDTPKEDEDIDTPEEETDEELPWEDANTPEESLPSPDGAIGDPRLQAALEESARLLRENDPEKRVAAEETPASPLLSKEPEGGEEIEGGIPPVGRRPMGVDPLQLGLDDVLPSGKDELPPRSPSEGVKVQDYTRRMRLDPREEAVQDAELLLRLGFEEQLTRSERPEALEEARHRARVRMHPPAQNETATVSSSGEYTDKNQTPMVEAAYHRAGRLGLTRLCVASVGALFGLLYDHLGVLTVAMGLGCSLPTHLYALMGLLWSLLICLPFLPRLGRGLKSLVDFEPTRYAVAALALLVSAANDLQAVFVHEPRLYGGVSLLMLAVAALAEQMTVVGEHKAFSVVSSGKGLFVLTDQAPIKTGVSSDTGSEETYLTAVRAGRLSDYFARTGRYNPCMGRLNYLVPVAFLVAIICAGMTILKGGSLWGEGCSVFTATFLACLPAFYVLAMSLPLARANGFLEKKGAAVIGMAAPKTYVKKGGACLLIRDGDALWGLNRKEITLREDPNALYWRRRAACLFRLLETPLAVEPLPGEEDMAGLYVEIAEVESDYGRFYLTDVRKGETTEILMGSRDALARRGIRLPKASMERVYKKTEDSRVLYLAFDRRFRIAYSVEYCWGRSFARLVEGLGKMGDRVALVAYDPLVSAALLEQPPFDRLPPVKLLRPAYIEPPTALRSGGVVATGRSLDLLHPYAACHRMKYCYRLSHGLSWLALFGGASLSLWAVLAGRADLLSSVAVTAWLLLFTLGTVASCLGIVTKGSLFLRRSSKKRGSGSETSSEKSKTKTDKERSS